MSKACNLAELMAVLSDMRLPVVGGDDWHKWVDTLANQLGRQLTREEIKTLARASHKQHADYLRQGKLSRSKWNSITPAKNPREIRNTRNRH